MRRVFKTRYFARWMRKTELSDEALCSAVDEMIQGLIDADLGGGVVKKRVGLSGRGKRGGARVVYFNEVQGHIWLLIVYAKAKFDNLPAEFLAQLKYEVEHG